VQNLQKSNSTILSKRHAFLNWDFAFFDRDREIGEKSRLIDESHRHSACHVNENVAEREREAIGKRKREFDMVRRDIDLRPPKN